MSPSVPLCEEIQPSVESVRSRTSAKLALKRWLREPLLQFLFIGLMLFAVNGYIQRGRPGGEPSKQINITVDDVRQLDAYFESQWHRPPTTEEFTALVEDKVQEEVLYREGLAMGLDKDDTIVKRRMAQKMHFLAEDVAAAHEPSTAELKAWFEKNSQTVRTAQPRTVPASVFFSGQARQRMPKKTRRRALAKIAGQAEDSKLPFAGRPLHVSGLLR